MKHPPEPPLIRFLRESPFPTRLCSVCGSTSFKKYTFIGAFNCINPKCKNYGNHPKEPFMISKLLCKIFGHRLTLQEPVWTGNNALVVTTKCSRCPHIQQLAFKRPYNWDEIPF